MVIEALYPFTDVGGLVAVSNGLDVQVYEPGQGVLVHGLNIGKIRYTEKQNGGMGGDWVVTITSFINFFFCC